MFVEFLDLWIYFSLSFGEIPGIISSNIFPIIFEDSRYSRTGQLEVVPAAHCTTAFVFFIVFHFG